jgi:alpha-amylase
LFRIAQAFMLAYPYGYPFLMSSYFFQHYDEGPPLDGQGLIQSVVLSNSGCPSPWICEHRFAEIPFLINFRNKLDSHFYISAWWQPRADQVVFTRSPKALAAFNLSDQPLDFRLQDFIESGKYCANLLTEETLFVSTFSSLCTHTLRVSEQPSRIRLEGRRALFLLRE